MLSKKAIAAFAAGATLVSGLAIAAPALAAKPTVNSGSGTPVVQSNDVTELKNVVFNFKVGDKDHKTTAITLYKKGDKYGADKSDINYNIAQIGAGLLAQVQKDITPTQDNSGIDTGTVAPITYPKTINTGDNNITVTLTYKSDVTDNVVKTMAGLGDFDAFKTLLNNNKKVISPKQKQLFDTERTTITSVNKKPKGWATKLETRVKNAGLLDSETNELVGFVKLNAYSVLKSPAHAKTVDYVNSKIIEYRAKHLDVIGLHELAAMLRKAKDFKESVQIFFGPKENPTKPGRDEAEKAYKDGKAALVKKAKDEGLNLIADQIEKSQYSTLDALTNLLKEAEIAKRHTNNAVAPAINNVPAYDGADLFKGLTYDQAKALYDEMNANAEAAKKDAKDGKIDADTVKLLAQAKTAFQKIVKAEIEKIAQKAEKEGFTSVAKQIRGVKTVEEARALLAEAEKGKPVPPAPVPPTPVPPAPVPTPTPTPVPGPDHVTPDHVTPSPVAPSPETNSGSPVSESESATLDKGELNVQIQGANSDLAAAGNAAGVSQAKADLKAALAAAQKVAADPHATQAQVDAAAKKLAAARKALANAKARAGEATGDSGKKNKLGNTGSAVSLVGMFAAVVAAAGVTLFAGKRRGVSRHCNK